MKKRNQVSTNPGLNLAQTLTVSTGYRSFNY